MFSDDEKELLKQLPGGVPNEFLHVPQPDGTVILKRILDCTKADLDAHMRVSQEVIDRADPKELEFWVQFYAKTPEREM